MSTPDNSQYLVDLLVPDTDGDTRVVDLRDLSDHSTEALRAEAAVAGDHALIDLIDQARAGRSC